jgi:hypothetical protein
MIQGRTIMRFPFLSLGVLSLFFDFGACQGQDAVDLPTGKKIISFEGFLSKVRWSQNGKTIVTCTFRKQKDDKDRTSFHFKTVELWDAMTGKRINSLGELEIPGFPLYFLSAMALGS